MHFHNAAVILLGSLYFAFASAVQTDEAIIKTDILNVRSGPGLNFERIGKVYRNETYPVLKEQDGWVKIKTPNQTGWAASKYLERSQQYREKEQTASGSAPVDKSMPSDANDLDQKTIVLDAGHGGKDSGAIGAGGTNEKMFTRRTVQELAQILTSLNAEVVLTRKSDHFVSLAARASLSNISNADAFISIHYNSFPQEPNVTGIETYFQNNQDKALARSVQKGIILGTGANDRGISNGDYQVTRQSAIPSILIESGYISNAEKAQLFRTDVYQKKLAAGIARGLNAYFMKTGF
ncbi:N-acetylmuramoyl-L-alanine amidase [Lentibacillus lipolyticus]|nr:N-acetylmuramoyl-L-alanine amidase [Lentibacillus lipolyticus]